MKRTLSLLLAALLICSMLPIFSVSAETTKYPDYLNLDDYYPFVKEEYKDQIELTIAICVGSDYSEDPQQRYYWKLMDKVFNLKCNVVQVTNPEEYITLTFAADDLPDMILGAGLTANQIHNYGLVEEQLLNVKPYINESLTPALYAIFEEMPEVEAGMTLPNGAIYNFPYLTAYDNPEKYTLSSINMEMLKEIGVEEKPHTLDELVKILYAMKELGDDVIPLAGTWETANPGTPILNAMGYQTSNGMGTTICLKNGAVTVPGMDEGYKTYLELMNQFYKDGIIDKDYLTADTIHLQAQTAEKRIGVLPTKCYYINANPEFYLKYETMPVLTSEQNSTPFAVESNWYSFGSFVISAKTKYPELCVRWADWMMTDEGTSAAWIGANKNNKRLMLEGYGGWYIDENYSRHDVDRDNQPDRWTGAVQYLREMVAGFNMGSLGTIIKEDDYRQSMSGLPLRPIQTVWELDPNNAGFYYRTNAYKELTDHLVVDINSLKFFFDEKTSERLIELESVLIDYVENQTAKFITGARSLDEFDAYMDELKGLDSEEYISIHANAYKVYADNLAGNH